MKKETYLKYRKQFLEQYYNLEKNELGFVKLSDFKIRNFDKFLFLFSCDILTCNYNLVVSSLSKSFLIKNQRPVSNIRIGSEKSMFDKYPECFYNALEYYSR